jgi:hypothetical protein
MRIWERFSDRPKHYNLGVCLLPGLIGRKEEPDMLEIRDFA